MSIFHKLLGRCLNTCFRSRKPESVDEHIQRLVKKKKRIQFIQIGASDCGLNDPLRKYILEGYATGLIVEPIKKYLSKAQKQYKSIPNLFFANCAIDHGKGKRTIFKIRDVEGLPNWAYQVCSFSKDVLLKHEKEIPNIVDLIEEESVRTEAIPALMKESGFQSPDLLVVDTEGYDAEILKMFPFSLHRPSLVIYEHKHLDEKGKVEAETLLDELKYISVKSDFDVIATLRQGRLLLFR